MFGNAGGPAQGAFEGTGHTENLQRRHQLQPHRHPDAADRAPGRRRALPQRSDPVRLRQERRDGHRHSRRQPRAIHQRLCRHSRSAVTPARCSVTRRACPGIARKPTSTSSIPGPRLITITPSSGASNPPHPRRFTAGSDLQPARDLYFGTPDSEATCTNVPRQRSAHGLRLDQPVSPTIWPASCWMCPTESARRQHLFPGVAAMADFLLSSGTTGRYLRS